MRLGKFVGTGILALILLALSVQADSGLVRGGAGIAQGDADDRYINEDGSGDSPTGTHSYALATLIAKAATADTHVVNRLFGDGRYARLAASNTFTSGVFTFSNPLTINFNAATTFDGLGFIMTMNATSWDFRGSLFAPFIINATTGPEAVNRDTGDARWGQLAAANTFTKANTFEGNMTIGNAAVDTVTVDSGTWTFTNPLTVNFDAATLFDATGFTLTFKANIVDFTTVATGVQVPNPACGTCALNSQTGDARYVAQTSIKSGTVPGATFAGNPKIFTATFGTAFPDTNYAVTITAEDNRTFTFQTKLAGSFVMNSNANLALVGDVDWTATAHNDP